MDLNAIWNIWFLLRLFEKYELGVLIKERGKKKEGGSRTACWKDALAGVISPKDS